MDQDSKITITDPAIVWHGHHHVTSPLEVLDGSMNERLAEIELVKPEHEHARRKQLLKLVDLNFDNSSSSLRTFLRAYGIILVVYYHTSNREVNEAFEKMTLRLTREFKEEILALHAEQCGCGWTPEKTNIFEYTDPPKA